MKMTANPYGSRALQLYKYAASFYVIMLYNTV